MAERKATMTTNDARVAVKAIAIRNCHVMTDIAAAIKSVMNIKAGFLYRKEFLSARTGEICDAIVNDLANILECEATTGVDMASVVANGGDIELPDYDLSNESPLGFALAP